VVAVVAVIGFFEDSASSLHRMNQETSGVEPRSE